MHLNINTVLTFWYEYYLYKKNNKTLNKQFIADRILNGSPQCRSYWGSVIVSQFEILIWNHMSNINVRENRRVNLKCSINKHRHNIGHKPQNKENQNTKRQHTQHRKLKIWVACVPSKNKNRRWIHVLVKSKQVLFLIRRPSCCSYCQVL